MKYCKNCGVQIDEDAKFCRECGTAQSCESQNRSAEVPEKPVQVRVESGISSTIVAVTTLILGVAGTAYGAITYTNDTSSYFGYNYEPPLSGHETATLVILVLGILALIIGLCCLCVPKEKGE